MSNDTVVSLAAPALVPDPLTELLRSGARRLVEAAVRAEFEEHLSAFGHEKLPDGRQRVVRNGRLPERKILTGLGEVEVRVPKARSRSGSPGPFRSSVAPPAWLATATSCSLSTTSPPRTGHTFEPPTSSNRPLPRSATEAREPRAASPERPCSRWSTRWVGARRNPGAGCGASDTSPRSSRESGSTTASRSSRTAEPPHEQPPVHQI